MPCGTLQLNRRRDWDGEVVHHTVVLPRQSGYLLADPLNVVEVSDTDSLMEVHRYKFSLSTWPWTL